MPERLKEIWWVGAAPQIGQPGGPARGVALPFLCGSSSHHFTYTEIVAFALCATSVTVLTGWAGQLSLGPDGLRRASAP